MIFQLEVFDTMNFDHVSFETKPEPEFSPTKMTALQSQFLDVHGKGAVYDSLDLSMVV